jgi:hypothetical protein
MAGKPVCASLKPILSALGSGGLISLPGSLEFWSRRRRVAPRPLRAADLHQRCIGPCSCFSSLQPVPHHVSHGVTNHRAVPHHVPDGVPLRPGEKSDSCSRR